MDLDISEEDLAFAKRLGAWLEENVDPDWLDRCTGYDDYVAEQNRWERMLTSSGWACRETCGEQAARVRRDAGDGGAQGIRDLDVGERPHDPASAHLAQVGDVLTDRTRLTVPISRPLWKKGS
ncbi:hypothetical protein [Nocardia sp. R6R-6]|uniref:hypothetical protein n=1 Tax=Nocardia sp. R6R-6 TaxID=3459303 RepID=UPI00403DBFA0